MRRSAAGEPRSTRPSTLLSSNGVSPGGARRGRSVGGGGVGGGGGGGSGTAGDGTTTIPIRRVAGVAAAAVCLIFLCGILMHFHGRVQSVGGGKSLNAPTGQRGVGAWHTAATAAVAASRLGGDGGGLSSPASSTPGPTEDTTLPRGAVFAFVFSTGRCGTQHLARVLGSAPEAVVTHESESPSLRPRDVVTRTYRRLAGLPTVTAHDAAAARHVRRQLLPALAARLTAAGGAAHTAVYTGHVPLAYGLGPALADALGTRLRVVRLRRERLATAVSLMALGPPEEDAWTSDVAVPAVAVGVAGGGGGASSRGLRWFPVPSAPFVALRVEAPVWARLNRFQRYLWYVDDIECRWQRLRSRLAEAQTLELQLEALDHLDGGREYGRLARFLGVRVNGTEAGVRHNSMQDKGRDKSNAGEATLRRWDREYRELVDGCDLGGGRMLSWKHMNDDGAGWLL